MLVDTGAGKLPDEDTGHLAEQLAAAGADSSQIDEVVITHFHMDHVGGLLRTDGSFDTEGDKAIQARQELFRRAAAAEVVLAGAHLPHLVRIAPRGRGCAAAQAAAAR